MHFFYTHGPSFSHILTLTHFGGLQHHSDSFNTSTFSNSEMSCTHVHHLQMFYHVSTHHTSAHLWIFNIIHTCAMCCQNFRTSADIPPLCNPSYSRYTISHLQTSSCMKAHICQISGIIHTWHAEYLKHLRKHLDTDSINSSAFLMHWFASLNTSIAQRHTSLLPLVIRVAQGWM